MIPRVIHFVWIGEARPAWADRNLAEFQRLNPRHETRLHNASALNPAYASAFAACSCVEQRADLVRYSVLEREGGWYFDLDFWPFRPLEDAERAWGLDGGQLAVALQAGQKGKSLTHANAPLACGPGLPVWEAVRNEILARTPPRGRTTFGPELVAWLARTHGHDLAVMGAPWWFPSSCADAANDFAAIQQDAQWARRMCSATGGQFPFAMHLWAGGQMTLPAGAANGPNTALMLADEKGPEFGRYDGPCELWPAGHPMAAIRRGLLRLGYQVVCRSARQAGAPPRYCGSGLPVLAVAWNAVRLPNAAIVGSLQAEGIPCIHVEHGFWQRSQYSQADCRGTQHRASWASRLRGPAPPEGAERLRAFYPDGLAPVRPRKDGYILVLGQVPKDSQLWDSDLQGPKPLQRAVKAALPAAMPVCFRPHPQCSHVSVPRQSQILPVLSGGPGEKAAYRQTKGGTGLAKALAGARFVITINSTAGNEALAAGVPVLAFGPALYLSAGVARPATLKTLKADIAAMLNGWCPEQAAVENYLRWLAARQWTAAELADGEVLAMLLRQAGVPLPQDCGMQVQAAGGAG